MGEHALGPEPPAEPSQAAESEEPKEWERVKKKQDAAIGWAFFGGLAAAVFFGHVERSWVPYAGAAIPAAALGYQVGLEAPPRRGGFYGLATAVATFVLVFGGTALARAPMSSPVLGQAIATVPAGNCRYGALPTTTGPRSLFTPSPKPLPDASALDWLVGDSDRSLQHANNPSACSHAAILRGVLALFIAVVVVGAGGGAILFGALNSWS